MSLDMFEPCVSQSQEIVYEKGVWEDAGRNLEIGIFVEFVYCTYTHGRDE